MANPVDCFLRARPPGSLLLVGVLLVPALGVVDLLTGLEISFSIFYLLPVYLVSWHVGRWPGLLISCLAAAVWLAADLLGGHLYSHPLVPLWNMATRLFVFALAAWLLSEIRRREARRRTLERIFFHDVLNLTTGIRGFAEILRDYDPAERREIHATILSAADQVIEEIEAQRALSAAEHHELLVETVPLGSRTLLEQVLEWYRHRETTGKVSLCLAPGSEEVAFASDRALLGRVLGNMVKNALEAARTGETVTAGCRLTGEMVEFWVHNPQCIPRRDQARVFRHSFSTKGRDRGLGTYSMRLLSRELGGEVSFTSSPKEGTVFRARYPVRFPEKGRGK